MERRPPVWDIPAVAKNPEKKQAAEASARDAYRRLMALPRPAKLDSPRQWLITAGLSTSTLTNMQGGAKAPSDPSINNLRMLLQAIGSSIPEMYLDEAEGRVVRAPSKRELEQALLDAFDEMPRQAGPRAAYLAEVVLELLALPADRDEARAAA